MFEKIKKYFRKRKFCRKQPNRCLDCPYREWVWSEYNQSAVFLRCHYEEKENK